MNEKKKDRNWLDSLKEMFQNEEYANMYPELLSYIEKYPNDDYGNFLYAKVLLKLGDRIEAKNRLETIAYGNSKIKYNSALILANLYAEDENIKEVYNMLTIYDNNPYNDRNSQLDLALIYLRIGKDREANKIVSNIDMSGAANNEIIKLANYYSYKREYKKTKTILSTFNNKKASTSQQLKVSDIYKRIECYDEALEIVKNIIKNNKKKDNIYYECRLRECEILIKKNLIDKAINMCYELCLDNCPAYKDKIYLTLGDAYLEQYNYQEAKKNYVEPLNSRNYESIIEATYKIAFLNDITNRYEEAKMYYESLIEKKSKYKKEAYYRLISLEIRNNDYEKAYDYYKETIELNLNENDYMESRITNVVLSSALSLELEDRLDYSYIERQVMNFDVEKSKEHIIDHRRLAGEEFNKNIDFDELYESTINNLTEENVCYGDFFDVYEIDYENVAPNRDKYRVIVIPNTKNIITMHPIRNCEHKYHKVSKFKEVEKKKEEESNLRKQKLYSKFYKN